MDDVARRNDECRKALLELYTSISLQYAGFVFAFAVTFFAEVNILEAATEHGAFPSALRVGIAASVPATFIGAVLTLMAYIFTRNIVNVIIDRSPENPDGKKNLRDIDKDYQLWNRQRSAWIIRGMAAKGGGIILKWTVRSGVASLVGVVLFSVVIPVLPPLWY